MLFNVHLDVDVLKESNGKIQYKYYIVSREVKQPFEYLYGATQGSGHRNRALIIHADKVAPGG